MSCWPLWTSLMKMLPPWRMAAPSRNSPKARCLVRQLPILRRQTPSPARTTPLFWQRALTVMMAKMPLLFPLMMVRPMSPVSLFLKQLRNRNRPSPNGPPAGKRPRRPKVWSRRKEFPQKQSLLSRWLPLRKVRRLMIAKRLRQKLLPLWPNRRQRQPLLPLLLPGAPPLPAAASLRS